ncbi:hsp70-like protein [Grosmannia clavigera kw1407]|uniref:Hsp70-like protein n=1 Tax=Grosmannia clavigera (strain kw1407 / UAMH 11150) TaxID=655863 RepID=F0XTU0_GROCL|nr:hsp70-like protein [Grosmannia clavigera kw1407]EFW98496.1 hsp70-like protein [Grosmannia clavigera kw1407]
MSNNPPMRPPPPGQRNRDKRTNYYATYSQGAIPPPPPPPPRNHGASSTSSLLLTPGGGGAAGNRAGVEAGVGGLTSGLGSLGLGLTPVMSKSASASSLVPSSAAAASAATAAMPGTNPVSAAEAIHGPIREPARETGPVPDRLIVGVDFGTTFSGVAVVYSATPDDIEIIKTWPGGNGITSDKVPTELMYDLPADAAAGTEPTVRWGFQFKPEEARLRCIKLFLDRSQKLPFYVSPLETAAQLSRHGKTVVDAAADYLTQVRRHTIDTLGRRYGASFMASTRVGYVLTCPAVWSDAAKNTTLLAAERAGMGDRAAIQMISEPEAAALYTLKAIQPNHLNVGDNVIVCDGGGGTVDLIAYKIISLKPLHVEESAVGTGGLCGSAFLNYRFEEHVRERLGASRFDEMKVKKSKTWQMGLRYFEEFVKRNFNEDEHQEVNIPLPGLPDDEAVGLDSGFLVMTADQVREIFEPVVTEVCDLVQGQVDGLRSKGGIVSGIILVGGFGQSDYLYRRVRACFSGSGSGAGDGDGEDGRPGVLPPPPYSERPTHAVAAAAAAAEAAMTTLSTQAAGPIEVMQPMYAWTAVVRGAVLRGLEGNMVLSRRARFHYGTSYATVYDETKHEVGERYWSPLWERWMVSDRMQWHIAKDDAISPLEPIAFHYTRNFRPGQSLLVTDDLLACAADEPPLAYTRGRDANLIHVCTLTTDLRAVPRSLFTRLTTTRGVEFDNLDFTLEMVVDSAGLGFELKVDGVRYGRVEAEFH